MRKQFNGLYAMVTHAMGQDVMTGDYFVFFNRRQDRCKILYWDRDGLVVWAKRLERGRFQIPSSQDGTISIEVDGTTLAMILGGVDVHTAQRRKRYKAPLPQRVDSRRLDHEESSVSCCVTAP
jgi:transposase